MGQQNRIAQAQFLEASGFRIETYLSGTGFFKAQAAPECQGGGPEFSRFAPVPEPDRS